MESTRHHKSMNSMLMSQKPNKNAATSATGMICKNTMLHDNTKVLSFVIVCIIKLYFNEPLSYEANAQRIFLVHARNEKKCTKIFRICRKSPSKHQVTCIL